MSWNPGKRTLNVYFESMIFNGPPQTLNTASVPVLARLKNYGIKQWSPGMAQRLNHQSLSRHIRALEVPSATYRSWPLWTSWGMDAQPSLDAIPWMHVLCVKTGYMPLHSWTISSIVIIIDHHVPLRFAVSMVHDVRTKDVNSMSLLLESTYFSQLPMGQIGFCHGCLAPRIRAMVIRSSSIKRHQLEVKVQTQASASWWSQMVSPGSQTGKL